MESFQKILSQNWKTLSYRSLSLTKDVYQLAKIRKINTPKTILFIFGCQRSGTTLLTEIFQRDFQNTKVYEEFSRLSSADKVHHIRLNPLHVVRAQIDHTRPPLVVLKPLVESQNAVKLLKYFKNSKALWVYRHYRDVAISNLEKWGSHNGINNLRPVVQAQTDNWRAEHVSEYSRTIVAKYFSDEMNPYDAAALFWFIRNRLFFEMHLEKNRNVLSCKYEDLIDNPARIIRNIYKFVGYNYPADKIPMKIYADSKGRGRNIQLSPEIDTLCNDMLAKLDLTHRVT